MFEQLRAALSRPVDPVATEHYQDGVEVVWDPGINIGFDGDSPTVPRQLTVHSRKMAKRIYRTGPVYCAVGYALANVIFVVGADGLIVVDTTESTEAATECLQDFREMLRRTQPASAALPVKAVILTHNHSDHIAGMRAFVDEAAQAAGVRVIAHRTMMEAVANNATVVAPILGARSAYSFGALLEVGPDGQVNGGIGPRLARGQATFLPPDLVFDDRLEVTLAGVRFDLRHAPSETDDEIIAWLPDHAILLSAEVIQGECLANVHTLRGTRYRDPQQWVRSIDAMRRFPAQFMVPAHGRPVAGAANVAELLTHYRDAIAFIHDQAVRMMNLGCTPDELAENLPALPPHLAQHGWLGEYYGTVRHSVRQVFCGQLGWFDGDPATLDPLPRVERARRMVELAGGRDAVLAKGCEAMRREDARWAAELASLLVRIDPQDTDARALKSEALTFLGVRTTNINWRNWYLTAARELQGAYDQPLKPGSGGALASPDMLAAIPLERLLESFTVRVSAERCFDVHSALALVIDDGGRTRHFALELRRGVLQIHADLPSLPDWPMLAGTLAMTRRTVTEIPRQGLPALMQSGAIAIRSGTPQTIAGFFGWFDPRPTTLPKLASR